MLIIDRLLNKVYMCDCSNLDNFKSPFLGAVYILLLIEEGDGHTEEERRLLATRVVLSNCRLALCSGAHEKDWMQAISQMFADSDFPDSEIVVTARSGGCPLSGLVEYFFACDQLDDITFTNFLIITINSKADDKELLLQAVHKYFS